MADRSEYDVGLPMKFGRYMSHHWLVIVFCFIEDDVTVCRVANKKMVE